MTQLNQERPFAPRDIDVRQFTKAERRILELYTFLLVFLLYFQLLAVPTPAGPLEAILPVTWLCFGYLALHGQLRVDAGGLLFFSLFAVLAIVGNIFLASGGGSFKISSITFVLAIYALYIFRVRVTDYLVLVCMDRFIFLMLLTIPIVALQWILQVVIHPGLWLSLEPVIPKPILLVFNYTHPIAWGSAWIQPNGAVFLEVSILAQFLTLAFIIEISIFQRAWRLAALGATILATFAASGPFMLGLCAPLLLLKLPRRLIPHAVVGGLIVLVMLTFTDVFSILLGRVTEVTSSTSSAYVRLSLPMKVITDYVLPNTNVFQGVGAGSGDQLGAFLAVAKLLTEYGVACTLSFMVMFIYTIARSRQPLLIIWAFFVFYQIMGGNLAVPVTAIATLLLCGFLERRPSLVRAARVPRRIPAPRRAGALPLGGDLEPAE